MLQVPGIGKCPNLRMICLASCAEELLKHWPVLKSEWRQRLQFKAGSRAKPRATRARPEKQSMQNQELMPIGSPVLSAYNFNSKLDGKLGNLLFRDISPRQR